MSDILSRLREANKARQVEWTSGHDKMTPTWRGCELAGEAGEAANIMKKLEREQRGWPGSRATVEQLADELADVIICTDLCAADFDIALEEAIVRKFNQISEEVGLKTRL